VLPLKAPPLQREHRLYQADWLYRFYGFSVDEIASATTGGMLDLAIDPKLAWALRNRALFPVDINRAPKEMLLRIPGLGVKAVGRIIETRRYHALRLEDVARLTSSLRKLLPFITAADWRPRSLDRADLEVRMRGPQRQLELFAA
jgi:predicted DNA-binding helix-hairpin-helix protein